ncbi:MAG: ankyrin repeat domain-containing protein, partial [Rhodobacterales bacterium]|nr:ankyrin repeat domain-containing protein [Rhodobacterales bacterium]
MARFTRHAAWLVAGALMMAGAAGPAALWPAEARAQDALAALDGPTRALFQAVEAGDAAAVRRALDAGADVTARDASGRTVAQIARHLGRRDVVAALSGARPPESSGPPASSGPS